MFSGGNKNFIHNNQEKNINRILQLFHILSNKFNSPIVLELAEKNIVTKLSVFIIFCLTSTSMFKRVKPKKDIKKYWENSTLIISFITQQIWISSSTPGSGWGGLGFESGSYRRLKKWCLLLLSLCWP